MPHALRPFYAAMFVALYSGCLQEQPAPRGQLTDRSASAYNTVLQDSVDFTDAANPSWNQVQYYSTIRYPDVNGDGASDVCGRYADGVHCAVDDGTGTGALINDAVWQSVFSDGAGWNQVQYYATLQYADVNGDGKADVCGRGIAGVYCALSTGTSFSTITLWQPQPSSAFSDANGWNQPQYYNTIQLADLNGDGKADLCGRYVSGVYCALSSGSAFGNAALWQQAYAAFSDSSGWNQIQYYSTIRLADVNGDGSADLCGRGSAGVYCALSQGASFQATALWQTDSMAFSDSNGWNQAQYYATIQYADVNDDKVADLCGRGAAGMDCALSTGSSFGAATLWQWPSLAFADTNGVGGTNWNQPQYYLTIRLQNGVLCGRGVLGLYCQYANVAEAPSLFTCQNSPCLQSSNESDANGWNAAGYYSTIRLAGDYKVAERGSTGILSTQALAKDQISIGTVAQLNSKRTALISHIWGTSTLDTTTTNVTVVQSPPVDVAHVPAGTTVTRYEVAMPTSGGIASKDQMAHVLGVADHYIPSGGSSRLVIVNPGHVCNYGDPMSGSPPSLDDRYQDSAIVDNLLADGYAVLATYMPEYTPLDCTYVSHDALFETPNLRPANGLHPLIYFLDTVRRSLNYVLQNYSYPQVYMTGLSGGGWTTTFYAALDTRISVSVPVAGSLPFYLRPVSDDEQEANPAATSTWSNDIFAFTSGSVKTVTGYKDLYILGAYGAGRRQIQVLNRNDSCCFGTNEYWGGPLTWQQSVRAYEAAVRAQLLTLGAGSFRLEINEADDCNIPNNCPSGMNCGCDTGTAFYRHEFSANTRVGVILTEFNGGTPLIAAAAGVSPIARASNGDLQQSKGPGLGWTDLGLQMVGTPTVLAGVINVADAFYRDQGNSLTYAKYDGSHWTMVTDTNQTIAADPVAFSSNTGRIDVIAVGADYLVHHWVVSGGTIVSETIPVQSGAYAVGRLGGASWGPNRMDMFFRGYADAGLYHVYSATGGSPYQSEGTGQVVKNFPAASAASSGTPTVYVAYDTTTDNLYEGALPSGGSWTFTNLTTQAGAGGSLPMGGTPASVTTGTGSQSVYMRCNGSQTNQIGLYTNPAGWHFNQEGGGPFIGSPAAVMSVAYAVDTSQAAWQFTNQTWQSLGGFVER